MYKINTFNNAIIEVSTGIHILPPYDSPKYLEYAEWVNSGNSPEVFFEEIIPVPDTVSRLQAKAALAQAGYLDSIEAYMSGPDAQILAKLAWTEAQEFRRTSPLVQNIGTMFNLDSAQLDELFIAASNIEV